MNAPTVANRPLFAASAMQAGLSALFSQRHLLTEKEVAARHRDICAFAWRTADLMEEAEHRGAPQQAAFIAALERLLAVAAQQAEAETARGSAALEEAQMSDAPGVTARAGLFSAERRREAAKIAGDIDTVRKHLNL